MTCTLVLPTSIATDIEVAARDELETAGVLLAVIAEAPNGDVRVLARKIIWVPKGAYLRREATEMGIASEGYVHALAEAEAHGCAALWVHTHPGEGASPTPSDHDRIVDSEISDLFRLRTGSPYYGAVIFSRGRSPLEFTGHLQKAEDPPTPLNRLWVVGDRWRLRHSFNSPLPSLPEAFDRNVRAFGPAIQQSLSELRVGIAGAGGTGSAVAEQLVRLGVRHLLLIDPDSLSSSNLTRVYGSSPAQVGVPKVHVLSQHLSRIAPDLQFEAVISTLNMLATAQRLTACDVIFGCTDDNAGRLVLSRLSTYFLTPVIDCGVLLSSDQSDRLIGIDGRVTTLVPGQACLVCRNRIDLARAGAELLPPAERIQRAEEGYAPALGNIEPAVVAYTTQVAAAAVSELLERLVGYGPSPRPSEVLLRIHDREISVNIAAPREGHYCHEASGKWGLGDTEPFLEQTWTS
jgi:molybdopterin/thiamine biosynthesis adenylyltransferase